MRSAAIRKRRALLANDIGMLVLALVSFGLLLYLMFFPHSSAAARWVFVVDTSICGVFLVEFLWRWRAAAWQPSFPLRNWYEVLGMIPVAHPALRGFRLVRVVVVVLRLARTADRAFGEKITQRVVARLSRPIVLAIKKPVTVAVLDEVVKVLETGNYAANIAHSINENRSELRNVIAEKVAADPRLGRLAAVPFHDQVVNTTVDTSMRVTLEVLTDPRIGDFISEVIRENRHQIRSAVEQGMNEQDVNGQDVNGQGVSGQGVSGQGVDDQPGNARAPGNTP